MQQSVAMLCNQREASWHNPWLTLPFPAEPAGMSHSTEYVHEVSPLTSEPSLPMTDNKDLGKALHDAAWEVFKASHVACCGSCSLPKPVPPATWSYQGMRLTQHVGNVWTGLYGHRLATAWACRPMISTRMLTQRAKRPKVFPVMLHSCRMSMKTFHHQD